MREDIDKFVQRFSELVEHRLGARLLGVVLFGSAARDQAVPGSDVDVLLVVDKRDREVEKALGAALSDLRATPDSAALAETGIDPVPAVVPVAASRFAAHPWLLLDVATDGRIYLDRDGFVAGHLASVRARLVVLGSRRVKSDQGWYWELKPGMRAGEVISL